MEGLDLFLRMHAVVHSRRVAEAEGGWSALEATLHAASEADLRATPQNMNSVVWALWHTARIEDVAANVVIVPGSQVLGGFDLGVPRGDIGVEMTKAEMRELSAGIHLPALVAYRDAVGQRTREVADAMPAVRWQESFGPEDAARVDASGALVPAGAWLKDFWGGKSMAWFLYWVCIEHSLMHLAYARMTGRLPEAGLTGAVEGTRMGRIYRIELPTPFPDGTVNAYLLPGEPCTLIDCGVAGADTLSAMSRVLRHAGTTFSDLRQVVLTHLHIDHTGALGELLQRAPGARVLVHTSAVAALCGDPEELARQRAFRRRFLTEAAMPRHPDGGRQQRQEPWYPPVEAVHAMQDGDSLRAGGADWRVLHTPGHSQSQICLHDGARLIAADHVLQDVAANAFIEPSAAGGVERPRALPEYRRELLRVRALPVRRVYPGHGVPFGGLRKVVDRRLRQQDERCQQVLRLLADGPQTAFSLARAMFPRLEGGAIFLGICQAVGHCDLLEDRGEVAARVREGAVWYERLAGRPVPDGEIAPDRRGE